MSDQDTATVDQDQQEFTAPPRHAPPQQRYQEGTPMGSPPERVGHGVPRGFAPSDRRGPRPLDLMTRTDEQFLRVKRVKVSKDADEDEVGTGYCGNVQDVIGFEDEISKKWGGGLYEIAGIYEGKQRVESTKIAGPSKPINQEQEEEEEEVADPYSYPADYTSDYTERSSYRGRGRRFGQGRYSSQGYGYDDPYASDPYGGGGYGQQASYGPQAPYGGGYGPQAPYAGGYGQQGSYGQQAPYAGGYGQQGSYVPPGMPGYQAPYAGGYGQQGSYVPPGMPGYQGVPGMPSNVYTPIPPAAPVVDEKANEELERMRAEIEEARAEARAAADQAAEERENRRLERQEAEAALREAELKREMDRMKQESDRKLDLLKAQADKQAEETRRQSERQAEIMQRAIDDAARRSEEQSRQFMAQLASLQNTEKGSSGFDKMMEMQMMTLQTQQAQAERDRLESQARYREEAAVRREAEAGKAEEYRRERERQDVLRTEERLREEQRRKDSEKHYQHLMELSQKGQQTPEQLLGMLKTMVSLAPKAENAGEKMMELAQVAMTMRDMFGGNVEQESKWERIIKTGGEALSGAIGKIQSNRASTQAPPAYQPAPQQMHALPGPSPQQAAAMRQQAMLQQQQQVARQQAMAQGSASRERDPEPADWGHILKFVVGCYDGESDPEETASHTYVMVNNGMQLPKALERLEGATVPELKFQLGLIKLSPEVAASDMVPAIDRLNEILNTEDGEAWFEEFITEIRGLSHSLRTERASDPAAQQAMQQQQAYARQQAAENQVAQQHQAMVQQQAQQAAQFQGMGPEQQAYVQQQAYARQQAMAQQQAQAQARAQAMAQQQAQAQQPQVPLTSEQFRAQADGVDLSPPEDFSTPPEGGTSADFAAKARGPVPPPPKSVWDEPQPPA